MDSESNAADRRQEDRSGYQVVARRYRPQGFAELIGQDHVARALIGAIQSDRIGHAYLFTGARGVGKTSSARIFAKALNCENGPTPTPCNECEICRAISTGDDIDVLEIDGASNRGVEEIRQIRIGATVRPARARYKIYIIDEVHMLTRDAFNALLKTLEEPPAHVKFIFCTTEPTKLPITILSRCQRYDFAGIDTRAIAAHLEHILRSEGVAADDEVCEAIARRAAGSMRDAQSLLEQLLSFAPEHIALADVHAMLGTVDDRKIYELLAAIEQEELGGIFSILARAADEGVDFGVLIEQTLGVFRDLLAVSAGCGARELLYSSSERLGDLKKFADAFGPERIVASMQTLDQTVTRMRYSTQGRILAELAFVRLASLGSVTSVAALIERLKTGKIPAAASVPLVAQTTEKKTTDRAAMIEAPPSAAETAEAPSNDSVFDSRDTFDACSDDPDARLALWRRATRTLSAALSAQSAVCEKIELLDNGRWRVVFPGDCSAAAKFCEAEAARLTEALSEADGRNIELEFLLLPPRPKVEPVRPKSPAVSKMELMRQGYEHPMVRKAEELFSAELEDVRFERG